MPTRKSRYANRYLALDDDGKLFVASAAITEPSDATNQDYVDAQIALSNRLTDDALVKVPKMSWYRGDSHEDYPDTAGEDLPMGVVSVWSFPEAQRLGLPGRLGSVMTVRFGIVMQQWYITSDHSGAVMYYRVKDLAGLTEWQQVPRNSATATAPEAEGTARPAGFRTVPLAMTLPGGNAELTNTTKSVRIARKYAQMPRFVRVHVSNFNPTRLTKSPATVLDGATIARGDANGNIGTAATVFPPGVTVPADGNELVSQWVRVPDGAGNHLTLSYGFSNGATQQALVGGAWQTDTPDKWKDSTTEAFVKTGGLDRVPFYIWIEALVHPDVQVMMLNGDSISMADGSTDPINDSWFSRAAFELGAMPTFMGQSGGAMKAWGADGYGWGNMYPGLTWAPDVIISNLGQNDLLESPTVNDLKTRYASVQAAYKRDFPGVPIVTADVIPYGRLAEQAPVRREFNKWLAAHNYGEVDHLKLAGVIGGPTDTENKPGLTTDGVHPNPEGHQVLADYLVSRSPLPTPPWRRS